jgi:pimeloyl-ACP methyl ester carboxylesterase
MDMKSFNLEITKSGEVFKADELEVSGLTDLFVVSHGWNNDMAEARALYDKLLKSISQVLDAGVAPQSLQGRKFGVLRVFWPSKKFAEDELIPGGGAASATHENDAALIKQLDELKTDPERLGGKDKDPKRTAALNKAQALVPKLEADRGAREEYVELLRSILNPDDKHFDDASKEFFDRDPEELFKGLGDGVNAPGAHGSGGSASGVHAGGAAGLGDLVSGVKAAARRLANFTTYYAMKERAGVVGRVGLAPVLKRLREQNKELRLHLIGHSFGGRVVTAAACAFSRDTPRVTISLLQAAYSHNGLAKNFDQKGHDGAFRAILSEHRASGPIIITHTKNDKAVGIAYPLASRIARQEAAALGDENDPYGGMGRNGAQATPEAKAKAGNLLHAGGAYNFAPGGVFNLKADDFISDHSDVGGQQVAYAILCAASKI